LRNKNDQHEVAKPGVSLAGDFRCCMYAVSGLHSAAFAELNHHGFGSAAMWFTSYIAPEQL
jgi:hypothetical protein